MFKRDSHGFSVITVLLAIFIVAVITACGVAVYNHQNPQPATTEAVLQGITKGAANTFSNAQFQAMSGWVAEYSGTGGSQVDGYDFKVSGTGSGIALNYEYSNKSTTTKRFLVLSKSIPPAKNLNEVVIWTNNKLKEYGFTTTDSKTYTRGDDKCNVLNDSNSLYPNMADYGQGAGNTNVLQIICFGTSTLQQTAASMDPFVKEYVAAHSDIKASDLTAGPLTIKSKNGSGVIGSSKNAGYDIAEMVLVNDGKKHIALYYAKNADIQNGTNTGWHYVTQANDEFGFSCKDMKANDDSRKAFFDQVCLSDTGQVKLDTNNRALQ